MKLQWQNGMQHKANSRQLVVLLGLLKAFMEDPVAKLGAQGTFGSPSWEMRGQLDAIGSNSSKK